MPNNTDRIERETMARLNGIYADALKQALKEQAAFLKKIKDVDDGKIKPPQYYVDRGEVDKWREGFTRELIRRQRVIEGIIKRLDAAGIEAEDVILKSMKEIWRVNREETAKLLQGEAKKAGINVNFAQYDAHQLDVLMQKNQSPFSQIAYKNLGQNPAVRRRLQNELSQATILGESQQKIIKRIQKVTKQAQWQARRVAQTERTRVQSQATYMTEQEAVAKGVNVVNRWSTRMVNSRETHIALDGKWAKHGERFPGSILRFPGDPEAPAGEVINCHCVLVPKVLKPGQEIDENGNVKTEKALQKASEPAKMDSVEACKDFDEMGEYLKAHYGISLDETVKELNFDLVKDAMRGIESVAQEYPDIFDSITQVTTENEGVMSCDREGITFNPQYFKGDRDGLLATWKEQVASGFWPKNSSPASTGAHEAGHAVELRLIAGNSLYQYNFERILAWNNCSEAKEIVSLACKNAKKSPYGKGKKNNELLSGISRYSNYTASEAMAEAFADVFANGENANPLSIEIKRIVKEKMEAYKGASH